MFISDNYHRTLKEGIATDQNAFKQKKLVLFQRSRDVIELFRTSHVYEEA